MMPANIANANAFSACNTTSNVITTTTAGLSAWMPGTGDNYVFSNYPSLQFYHFQEQPMKPAEKFLVIAQSNGAIHSRHESAEDAEAAAARAAAKADEVYLVFRAVKQFQQKPVDVESRDL